MQVRKKKNIDQNYTWVYIQTLIGFRLESSLKHCLGLYLSILKTLVWFFQVHTTKVVLFNIWVYTQGLLGFMFKYKCKTYEKVIGFMFETIRYWNANSCIFLQSLPYYNIVKKNFISQDHPPAKKNNRYISGFCHYLLKCRVDSMNIHSFLFFDIRKLF